MAQTIFSSDISTLTAIVNNNWQQMPVMQLGSNDVLTVGFDQLSHEYHRYKYHIQHCEADGTPSDDIFENDFLVGFNDNCIDDYTESINTNQLYTHYSFQIPNNRCRLKMSGNYLLTVFDENNDDERVLELPFYVVEPLMTMGMEVFTNTDATINKHHQQLNMRLDYGGLRVTYPERQILTVVRQNGLCTNASMRTGIKPNIVKDKGLEWTHNQNLIFDAGNEYKKFEILDTDHPSMGVDRISWDGERFHAWVFTDEIQTSYLTDEDANGAFIGCPQGASIFLMDSPSAYTASGNYPSGWNCWDYSGSSGQTLATYCHDEEHPTPSGATVHNWHYVNGVPTPW